MKSNRKVFILILSLFVVLATYTICETKNTMKKTETTVKSNSFKLNSFK